MLLEKEAVRNALINFGVGDSKHGPQLHRIKLLIVSRAGRIAPPTQRRYSSCFSAPETKRHICQISSYTTKGRRDLDNA
jgi:hypothetical protein